MSAALHPWFRMIQVMIGTTTGPPRPPPIVTIDRALPLFLTNHLATAAFTVS